MSITNHTTSKEVARHTRAARQKIVARSAMEKMSRTPIELQNVPLNEPIRISGTNLASKSFKMLDVPKEMVPRGGTVYSVQVTVNIHNK